MILDYLYKNPDASDTLEGISKWWMEYERVNQSVDKVSEAVYEMVKKGLLKKLKIGNDSFIFKIEGECKKF